MKPDIIFDAHADTITELFDHGGNLYENNLHIDAKRMAEYASYTQIFAVFISPEHKNNAMEYTRSVIDMFRREADACGITVCKSFSERQNSKTPVCAFLSLEGGEPIESTDDLHLLHALGIRMLAPTWNFKNRLACGVFEPVDTGFTEFGKKIISEAEKLGIIIDVSHLSPNSFRDAVKIMKKPFVASHSCSKSIRNHPRNLTDEQFLAIKRSGGVAGINFHRDFLGDDISDIVSHIDRFLALGGEDNIGFGSDFDGTRSMPRGICGVQSTDKIIKLLPYPANIREKIAYRNFLRLFKSFGC